MEFEDESQANPMELESEPNDHQHLQTERTKPKNIFGDEVSQSEIDIYKQISTEEKLVDIMNRKDFQDPIPLKSESDSSERLPPPSSKKKIKIKLPGSKMEEFDRKTKA
mmetsp:Transcript_21051/g.32582  ORF Transcript_21051/g.32582 Transcript_21051/m.32582 type:complete len:109 (+) Transcript_21051:3428-3754(+)